MARGTVALPSHARGEAPGPRARDDGECDAGNIHDLETSVSTIYNQVLSLGNLPYGDFDGELSDFPGFVNYDILQKTTSPIIDDSQMVATP